MKKKKCVADVVLLYGVGVGSSLYLVVLMIFVGWLW